MIIVHNANSDTIFPYTLKMSVQVWCNGRQIDEGYISNIFHEGEQSAMKVVSQRFQPGETRTFVLMRGCNPADEVWHEFYKNHLREGYDEEFIRQFQFIPLRMQQYQKATA